MWKTKKLIYEEPAEVLAFLPYFHHLAMCFLTGTMGLSHPSLRFVLMLCVYGGCKMQL